MSGHPPPVIIQETSPPIFVRIGLPGQAPAPRYMVCGQPTEEAMFYMLLADWMRRGEKPTCAEVLPPPS